MDGELNNLSYNNTNITFTNNVNNIATSDETTASPIYQDKMGTAYSRSKSVARAFNFAGISLILTAAAIKTGSLIANAYVLNPPSLSNQNYIVENHIFKAEFSVSNPMKYKITAYLFMNEKEEPVIQEDCTEQKEYLIEYNELEKGDSGRFYIEFTNTVDYRKTIDSYVFNVEE